MPQAAVVTGASTGIGRAVAERLLERGHTVITLQRSRPAWSHPSLIAYQVDLADAHATRAIAGEIAGAHPVRYLVNNAGANRPAAIENATVEDLAYVSSVTLGASLLLMQAFLPGMREARFGRVVNVSSRAVLGKSERVVYSSAKAGLIGMTRTSAIETGRDGITINAVVPGPVASELFDRGHPHGGTKRQLVIDRILVGRVGEPADIAHAILFLLAPESGYITGQALFVCGGTSVTGTGGE
ncbi:MAG: SDR family oxidoreductase [Proteobacteria bacterium]|nr:SDR family oxidoreductase [Burkholderiales bacterium]